MAPRALPEGRAAACRSTSHALTVQSVIPLVRFALCAFFPRVDDLPGLLDLDVDRQIEALRRESTWLFWLGVVAASVVFQVTPIFTVQRPLLAVWLTPEELDAHAHELATHPLYLFRQLTVLLKLVAGMFWGQSAEVRAYLALPAYPEDPGTRRLGPSVARFVPGARAPTPALLALGRREVARGRGPLALERRVEPEVAETLAELDCAPSEPGGADRNAAAGAEGA
jgi:hypothetical protein